MKDEEILKLAFIIVLIGLGLLYILSNNKYFFDIFEKKQNFNKYENKEIYNKFSFESFINNNLENNAYYITGKIKKIKKNNKTMKITLNINKNIDFYLFENLSNLNLNDEVKIYFRNINGFFIVDLIKKEK